MVTTVPKAGWAGLTNGELLKRIAGEFDVFITVDRNLPAQQNVAALSFGVIVLRATSNALTALKPLMPHVSAALERTGPGRVEIIS